jgi:hypothetical protein
VAREKEAKLGRCGKEGAGAAIRPEQIGEEWPTGAKPALERMSRRAEAGLRAKRKGRKKEIPFLFFKPILKAKFKSSRNLISNQTIQKSLCSSMNAHT